MVSRINIVLSCNELIRCKSSLSTDSPEFRSRLRRAICFEMLSTKSASKSIRTSKIEIIR